MIILAIILALITTWCLLEKYFFGDRRSKQIEDFVIHVWWWVVNTNFNKLVLKSQKRSYKLIQATFGKNRGIRLRRAFAFMALVSLIPLVTAAFFVGFSKAFFNAEHLSIWLEATILGGITLFGSVKLTLFVLRRLIAKLNIFTFTSGLGLDLFGAILLPLFCILILSSIKTFGLSQFEIKPRLVNDAPSYLFVTWAGADDDWHVGPHMLDHPNSIVVMLNKGLDKAVRNRIPACWNIDRVSHIPAKVRAELQDKIVLRDEYAQIPKISRSQALDEPNLSCHFLGFYEGSFDYIEALDRPALEREYLSQEIFLSTDSFEPDLGMKIYGSVVREISATITTIDGVIRYRAIRIGVRRAANNWCIVMSALPTAMHLVFLIAVVVLKLLASTFRRLTERTCRFVADHKEGVFLALTILCMILSGPVTAIAYIQDLLAPKQ